MQGEVDGYKRPSDLHGLPKDIELYQFEVCPYCCKVKAALDYYNVRNPDDTQPKHRAIAVNCVVLLLPPPPAAIGSLATTSLINLCHHHLLFPMQLPYNVVEVNPLTKAQLKWSEYKKVSGICLLSGCHCWRSKVQYVTQVPET